MEEIRKRRDEKSVQSVCVSSAAVHSYTCSPLIASKFGQTFWSTPTLSTLSPDSNPRNFIIVCVCVGLSFPIYCHSYLYFGGKRGKRREMSRMQRIPSDITLGRFVPRILMIADLADTFRQKQLLGILEQSC